MGRLWLWHAWSPAEARRTAAERPFALFRDASSLANLADAERAKWLRLRTALGAG